MQETILNDSAKSKQRSIFRHICENEKEKVRTNKRTPSEKMYKLRSQAIERNYTDAKELMVFATQGGEGVSQSRNSLT